jgi:hypothetical protein
MARLRQYNECSNMLAGTEQAWSTYFGGWKYNRSFYEESV